MGQSSSKKSGGDGRPKHVMMGFDNCKLSVLGSTGVGKTSIVQRFVNGTWVDKVEESVEDVYRKETTYDSYTWNLEILDTVDKDENFETRQKFVQASKGYICVFSIDDRNSFESLKVLHNYDVFPESDVSKSILIVGNKSDLDKERAVSTSEGQELAKSYSAQYIEVSAKNNVNIEKIFHFLALEISRRNYRPPVK
eukprot:TRINITY_DN828_c0_g1_i1.p1 TRINITY_DN828_c0_g1~~TRINITY_DN828_c0_g1_i1.p1  ORF type:complete len:196 (-),score=27.73 TRINITY_DN828_c0_g1_i1:112-699(-)